MDKKDLIVEISRGTGATQHDTRNFLDAFVDVVTKNLTVNNKIRIIGFGTFEVRVRGERKGINPATKEEITIPASVVPVFKPGQGFKNIVTDHNDRLGK